MIGLGLGLSLASPNLGGPKYDPLAVALFARMSGQPDYIRKDLISDRYKSGKEKTWWPGLVGLVITAAHDQQAGRLNWKGNIYDCLPVNNPAFIMDRGFAPNGSSSYLNTQFNPLIAGDARFTQDSACLGFRFNTENISPSSFAGFFDSALQRGSTLNPRIDGTGKASFRVNSATAAETPVSAIPSSIGMFLANRTSSAGSSGYRNGVSVVVGSQQPSTPLANGALRFGSTFDSSFRGGQFSLGLYGRGLTAAEAQDIHEWFEVYRLAVGIP